jgi:hypothetical protein
VPPADSDPQGPDPGGLFDWRPGRSQTDLLRLGLGVAGTDVGSHDETGREGLPAQTRAFAERCSAEGSSPRHGTRQMFDGWRIGGDRLDWGTSRLLPLAAWTGTEHLGTSPGAKALLNLLGRSMLLRRAQDAAAGSLVGELRAGGIETLVLKGAALGRLAYPDPGTRPMSDVDLLIRGSDLDRTLEWIAAHGGTLDLPVESTSRLRRFRHSIGVAFPAGGPPNFDLHWRTQYERFDDEADESLWRSPLSISLSGVTSWTPAREHHLVHAIAHGLGPNALASVRWVADVALLARHPSFDWDEVVRDVRRRKVGRIVAQGLRIVDEIVPGSVPGDITRGLDRGAIGRVDLWCRRLSGSQARGFLVRVPLHYLVATTTWPMHRRIAATAAYLRFASETGMLRPGRRRAPAESV